MAVRGHPLQLKTCFVADAEERGQVCAQEFLNDPSVIGVLVGSLITGASSFHQTNGGELAVLGTVSNDSSDATAKNAYCLNGGQYATTDVVSYAMKYLKAKSAAIMTPSDNPVAAAGAAAVESAFKASGVKATTATYSTGATDYTASILASGARDADAMVVLATTPQQCSGISQALTQLAVDKRSSRSTSA